MAMIVGTPGIQRDAEIEDSIKTLAKPGAKLISAPAYRDNRYVPSCIFAVSSVVAQSAQSGLLKGCLLLVPVTHPYPSRQSLRNIYFRAPKEDRERRPQSVINQ